MKKIAFVLVLLLFAAPALATVTISATQVGTTNEVEISYISDGNLPRAFGLDITVTAGTITACDANMTGECDAIKRGYGIFPGSIQIDNNGNVTDVGRPDALGTARGALGGIDTNGITVELGSLYEEPNAPPSNGVLCTITVTDNCIVRIAGNAARCGVGSEPKGVVMEDWEEAPVITYVDGPVIVDCFDSGHPKYTEWVAVGKPNSWCYKYQCYGDADGMRNGNPFAGYSRVRIDDLNILITGWEVENYIDEATHPWIAADFNRNLDGNPFAGYSRVRIDDLNILVTHWESDAGIPMATPNCGGDIDLTPP